jgi:hypothetical protein
MNNGTMVRSWQLGPHPMPSPDAVKAGVTELMARQLITDIDVSLDYISQDTWDITITYHDLVVRKLNLGWNCMYSCDSTALQHIVQFSSSSPETFVETHCPEKSA